MERNARNPRCFCNVFGCIEDISQDGSTIFGEVHANLVGSTGLEFALDLCKSVCKTMQHLVVGYCLLALFKFGCEFYAVVWVSAKECFDFSILRELGRIAQGMVAAHDLMRGKIGDKFVVSTLCFGHNHEPGCVFVQAMHNARSVLLAHVDDGGIMGDEPIDESIIEVPCPRVYNYASVFIENKYIVVLEYDIKRH